MKFGTSWKVPFLKHPCKKGRCITSMVCKQEDVNCKIFSDFDNQMDKYMEHLNGDNFMELSFIHKLEGSIFVIMMCCAYPKHAIKQILSFISHKISELEQKIEDDY